MVDEQLRQEKSDNDQFYERIFNCKIFTEFKTKTCLRNVLLQGNWYFNQLLNLKWYLLIKSFNGSKNKRKFIQ